MPPAAVASNGAAKRFCVIGGGITGLTSAWYLSRLLKRRGPYAGTQENWNDGSGENAPITLYESSNRFGGWLQTVNKDGIIVEQGPRTLRGSNNFAFYLAYELGLQDKIVTVPKRSPAESAYIYYPDHLVRVSPYPKWTSIIPFFGEPIITGALRELLLEGSKPKLHEPYPDRSVDTFIKERFGPQLSNLVSAMFRGIYAGDIANLSARKTMQSVFEGMLKYGDLGTYVQESIIKRKPVLTKDATDMSLRSEFSSNLNYFKENELLKNTTAVFSFKDGIETLTKALVNELKKDPLVRIHRNTGVNKITPHSNEEGGQVSGVKVQVANEKGELTESVFDKVISSMPHNKMGQVLESCIPPTDPAIYPVDPAKMLSAIPYTSVMVVNIHIAKPASEVLPVNGFGYLLPKGLDELGGNPEQVLGVVFDSESFSRNSGTDLTVMMGGYLWSDPSEYPDENEAISRCKSLLKRQINLDLDKFLSQDSSSVKFNAVLQKECILQFPVGYMDWQDILDRYLNDTFNGHLALAGSAVIGPSVDTCIQSALRAAWRYAADSQFTGCKY